MLNRIPGIARVSHVSPQPSFTRPPPAIGRRGQIVPLTGYGAQPGSIVKKRRRTVLTAALSLYVRTDGSDTNNGMSNVAGGAFLTLQAAINYVANKLDLNGNAVTIQVGAGTYAAGVTIDGPFVGTSGGGSVSLVGDTTTPSNVLISVTSANCIVAQNGAVVNVGGFKVVAATSGIGLAATTSARIIQTGKMDFGACATSHFNVASGGKITNFGVNYDITGAAPAHWLANGTGSLVSVQLSTITITGTPAFSSQFASASSLCHVLCNANTFSGSATGTRYSATLNAVIESGGATLPGNAAGSTATGGQYS